MPVWILVCSHNSWNDGALFMNGNLKDRVEEHRAAVLLGLSSTELRRYSRVCGLGHLESSDRGEEMVFTYEELCRLCLLAAQSSK